MVIYNDNCDVQRGWSMIFSYQRKIFFHHALQSPSPLFREDTYCIMGQKPIIIISTVKIVIWSENNMFCFLWMSLLKCTRILPKISFFYVLIKGIHYSLYLTSNVQSLIFWNHFIEFIGDRYKIFWNCIS